jgi:hypothetical protein
MDHDHEEQPYQSSDRYGSAYIPSEGGGYGYQHQHQQQHQHRHNQESSGAASQTTSSSSQFTHAGGASQRSVAQSNNQQRLLQYSQHHPAPSSMYDEQQQQQQQPIGEHPPLLEIPEEIYAVRKAALQVLKPLTSSWVSSQGASFRYGREGGWVYRTYILHNHWWVL